MSKNVLVKKDCGMCEHSVEFIFGLDCEKGLEDMYASKCEEFELKVLLRPEEE